ncbi:MAG: hypothetical protein JST26_01760 [Bacteroidetes bacterium]|nr:hypothetical protein [Bacteroidota bacterium]
MLFRAGNFCFSQNTIPEVQITDHKVQKKIIGQLGKPLGTLLSVRGIITDQHAKGYNSGLNLTVQSINDSAIQEPLTIPLSPYFGKFGNGSLPQPEKDSTYQLRVYETGAFVGVPPDAYKEADIDLQTSGFYFQNKLIVLSGKKIKPIVETPDMFIGRVALLSGIATNQNDTAYINTPKGKLKLMGSRKWTKAETGKLVEVYGKIEQTESGDIYNVRDGVPGLVHLKDQIGMPVKLRGLAMSMNGYWWFSYRGMDIYVEDMEKLPGWTEENHFRPMEITGVLDRARLPRPEQITLKPDRDTALYYIVRKPAWKPIERLLTCEIRETEN